MVSALYHALEVVQLAHHNLTAPNVMNKMVLNMLIKDFAYPLLL